MVSVELCNPPDQVGTRVAARPAAAMLSLARGDHPVWQGARSRQRKVPTEKLRVAAAGRPSREPVLVAKHAAGRMAEIRQRAVEHRSSVGGHCGKAPQSITRLCAESCKKHHSDRGSFRVGFGAGARWVNWRICRKVRQRCRKICSLRSARNLSVCLRWPRCAAPACSCQASLSPRKLDEPGGRSDLSVNFIHS